MSVFTHVNWGIFSCKFFESPGPDLDVNQLYNMADAKFMNYEQLRTVAPSTSSSGLGMPA